jgi:sulfite exporter TauE/SafE
MAAGLVFTALDAGRWLKPLPGVRHVSGWMLRGSAALAPVARAGAIGAATPFLPCGLVYGMAFTALASGSAGRGFAVMGACALGGVPALGLAQLGAARVPPGWVSVARRAVPLAAACVLVWRAVTAGPSDTMCR